MELVLDEDIVKLFQGDCRKVIASLPDNSVDAIVTDPPYELGFMGKKWDASGIAYDPVVWGQSLRVLRPGGHLLAFGGTRTWHRVACAIEDAGFEIRDNMAWLYGSGFPKSMNVAKAVDKEGGADAASAWEGWGTALKPAHEPIVCARKPLERGLTVAQNLLKWGTGALNIDACRIATRDKLGGGAESGQAKRAHDGWNRPWMDDVDSQERHAERVRANVAHAESLGRFPANVIFDESQAAALDEQSGVLTSGLMKARTERQPRPGGTIYGADKRNIVSGDTYADSGGASRFFYVAKAPSSERPEVDGHQHSTVKPLTLMRYLVKLVTPPPRGCGGLVRGVGDHA